MRSLKISGLVLLIFLGLACARQTGIVIDDYQSITGPAEEAQLLAYDRQEGHFQDLYQELLRKYGRDPQLIEARELASVAEEFYLIAEYQTAMEMLQQAVRLLEEKRRLEEANL